jgi:UDP-2-acetamido-3-amino-2,3-dideoxy-glucuronate N-acetyltransferase
MSNIFIHSTANVSDKTQIGDGTKVWINVQVRENVEIGANCIISKDVYLDHGVKIGNRCKIQNSVSVYKGVTIEDDVFVGPSVAFTNDKIPRAFNAEWKIIPTLVEKGASIGANATIVCGVTIGRYAMVAAGSVVTKSIPEHALVMGNPAKVIACVCECGSRLDNQNKCSVCGKVANIKKSSGVI